MFICILSRSHSQLMPVQWSYNWHLMILNRILYEFQLHWTSGADEWGIDLLKSLSEWRPMNWQTFHRICKTHWTLILLHISFDSDNENVFELSQNTNPSQLRRMLSHISLKFMPNTQSTAPDQICKNKFLFGLLRWCRRRYRSSHVSDVSLELNTCYMSAEKSFVCTRGIERERERSRMMVTWKNLNLGSINVNTQQAGYRAVDTWMGEIYWINSRTLHGFAQIFSNNVISQTLLFVELLSVSQMSRIEVCFSCYLFTPFAELGFVHIAITKQQRRLTSAYLLHIWNWNEYLILWSLQIQKQKAQSVAKKERESHEKLLCVKSAKFLN